MFLNAHAKRRKMGRYNIFFFPKWSRLIFYDGIISKINHVLWWIWRLHYKRCCWNIKREVSMRAVLCILCGVLLVLKELINFLNTSALLTNMTYDVNLYPSQKQLQKTILIITGLITLFIITNTATLTSYYAKINKTYIL